MEKENEKNEILEAINEFSTKVDERLIKIESQMVTKDYLDEKMADLRGDMVVLTRKEDTKVKRLAEMLREKDIITEEQKKEIFSMEPFPQLML